MDTLPTELLIHTFSYLPVGSRSTARLICRNFNAILVKTQFMLLATFIDPDVSQSACELAASDLSRRPRSIWSPHCPVPPKLPIPKSFLLALYTGLSGGRSWWYTDIVNPSGPGDLDVVNTETLRRKLGRGDITEDNVRQALFRYALYLSYNHPEDSKERLACDWVLDVKYWGP